MKQIAFVAWHLDEISGTTTVIRTLLRNFPIPPQKKNDFKFWVILKDIASDNLEDPFKESLIEKGFHLQKILLNPNQSRRNWLEVADKFMMDEGIDLAVYFDINLPKLKPQQPKTISVIHDIMPLVLPDYYLDPFKYYAEKRKYKRAIKVDGVVTVSNYSKNEMIRKLKLNTDQVRVIYNGVDDFLEPSIEWSKRKGVLYVGDFRNRKNVYRLAEAYLKLPSTIKAEHPLLLTGKGGLKKKIIKLFEKNKLLTSLRFLGQLGYDSLSDFYRQGYVFVFPSVMEGFGLPVIEAQRHRLPVICGRHSSLEEIGQDSVRYANILNPVSIAEEIQKLIEDPKIHLEFSEKGYKNSLRFSGTQMGKAYLDYIGEILTKPMSGSSVR